MLIGWVVVIVAIVGLLIYVLAANPKVVRVGEILFFCGALVTLAVLASKSVRLL